MIFAAVSDAFVIMRWLLTFRAYYSIIINNFKNEKVFSAVILYAILS